MTRTELEAKMSAKLNKLDQGQYLGLGGVNQCSTEVMRLIDSYQREEIERAQATTLQPFEVQDYKRLLALESRGVEDYRQLRQAPALTAEAVVSFINQLSPWNLKTTGIAVLKAYVDKQAALPPQQENTKVRSAGV